MLNLLNLDCKDTVLGLLWSLLCLHAWIDVFSVRECVVNIVNMVSVSELLNLPPLFDTAEILQVCFLCLSWTSGVTYQDTTERENYRESGRSQSHGEKDSREKVCTTNN